MEAQGQAERDVVSEGAVDFYRLLRVDPDAPQELVTEAYWYLASGIRDRLPLRQGAERELNALNNAYAVLVDPEKRQAYDETVSRVVEIRRERAERRTSKRQPLLARLLVKPRPQVVDPYELLRVDPAAGPALIARAYLILRSLYSKGETTGSSAEQLKLLAEARSQLLERFAKGASSEPSTALAANGSLLSKAATTGSKAASAKAKSSEAHLKRRRQQEDQPATGDLPDERLFRDTVSPMAAPQTAEEVPEPFSPARLILDRPLGGQQVIRLGETPVTLGGDESCDIRLTAEPGKIADMHARIWFAGDRFVIRSLDSLHPTTIGGQRVVWAVLEDGDDIQIGGHRLRFEIRGALDQPPGFLTVEHDGAMSVEEISERHE